MNQERLLTESEMKEVEEFVLNNQRLRNPHLVNFGGDDITSVHNISEKEGLVFIYGNKYTGLHHIQRRHTVLYGSPFRISDDEKRNPSQFYERYIPILDYPIIADQIFEPGNKVVEDNKSPDVFDVYIGDYTDLDDHTVSYKLILYKNTKIVHTFFPKNRKSNRAIVEKFGFRRGGVSCTEDMMQCTVKITLPYLDKHNKVRYSVEWNLDGPSKTEEVILWAHDENEKHKKHAVIAKREFNGPLPSISYALYLEYTDLRWIERMIKSDDDDPTKSTPER